MRDTRLRLLPSFSQKMLPILHQLYICSHWAKISQVWSFIALFANLTQLPSSQDGRSKGNIHTPTHTVDWPLSPFLAVTDWSVYSYCNQQKPWLDSSNSLDSSLIQWNITCIVFQIIHIILQILRFREDAFNLGPSGYKTHLLYLAILAGKASYLLLTPCYYYLTESIYISLLYYYLLQF